MESLADVTRRCVVVAEQAARAVNRHVTPGPGVSMLPLSSVARDMMVTAPLPAADHV